MPVASGTLRLFIVESELTTNKRILRLVDVITEHSKAYLQSIMHKAYTTLIKDNKKFKVRVGDRTDLRQECMCHCGV